MKEEISARFNKKTVVVAIASFALLAGGTATVLDFFAESTGTVNVDEAVTASDDGISFTADTTGDYFESSFGSSDTLTLDNNRDEATRINMVSSYKDAGGSTYQEEVQGAVTHNFVYEERSSSDYDVTVSTSTELEEAIDNSTEGILVESGTYTISSEVKLGASTTVLESREGATATTINFDNGQIEANGDDLTVRGFKFTGQSNSSIGDTEGVLFHTTGGGISGSFVVEKNIFDTSEPYRDVWTQDTATVEVKNNFFYGEDTDAAVEVNLDDSGTGNIYIDSNTFVSYPSGEKAVALRTDSGSTGDLEVVKNNFVYVGNSIEHTSDADLTDSSGNYFAYDGSQNSGLDDTSVDFSGGSATEPSFNNKAEVPLSRDGIKTLPVDTTVHVGQVNYLSEALQTGSYGFETTVAPAP